MKAVKCVVLLACLFGTVYLHVWQRVQVIRLGYEIAGREEKREQLLRDRRLLRLEYGRASAPDRLLGAAAYEFGESVSRSLQIVDVVTARGDLAGERVTGE